MIVDQDPGDNAVVFRMQSFNCGMCIPLSDDKHRFVRDSSLCALKIQDNVQDKFFSEIFFLTEFFSNKKYFSQILSLTEFYL